MFIFGCQRLIGSRVAVEAGFVLGEGGMTENLNLELPRASKRGSLILPPVLHTQLSQPIVEASKSNGSTITEGYMRPFYSALIFI